MIQAALMWILEIDTNLCRATKADFRSESLYNPYHRLLFAQCTNQSLVRRFNFQIRSESQTTGRRSLSFDSDDIAEDCSEAFDINMAWFISAVHLVTCSEQSRVLSWSASPTTLHIHNEYRAIGGCVDRACLDEDSGNWDIGKQGRISDNPNW
jgi:hypothetical protein